MANRRKINGLFAVTASIALFLFATGSVAGPTEQAKGVSGIINGVRHGDVVAFLGIPYAAPPTGANRWRAPRPATRWSGGLQADHFAASCEQQIFPSGFGPWTKEYVVSGPVSEDCLYLNIWRPAQTAKDKLSVLVWIHGGGFSQGSGSVAIYDGAALARKGVVVVTLNYRLGVYGFLAHPELTAESPAHASGNYGLLDQVAALEWIRDNIAAFGGDPARVTVAGQSAGSASVHYLIATPLARGLFAQTIAESGSGMGVPVSDRAAGEASGMRLEQASGVKGIAGLRKLSPKELDAAILKSTAIANSEAPAGTPVIRFGPVVDGLVLPKSDTADANTNDTPMLTGMTADEMTGMDPNYGKSTPESLRSELSSRYGVFANDLNERYGSKTDNEANTKRDALSRDRGLASMYFWARRRLTTSSKPVYMYLWSHSEPGPNAERYKAFHSSEIPYVFGRLDTAGRPFTEEDRRLSELLGSYWVNWIKTGDPNGPELPHWPRFTMNEKQILEIGDHISPRKILDEQGLELFDRYIRSGGSLSLF